MFFCQNVCENLDRIHMGFRLKFIWIFSRSAGNVAKFGQKVESCTKFSQTSFYKFRLWKRKLTGCKSKLNQKITLSAKITSGRLWFGVNHKWNFLPLTPCQYQIHATPVPWSEIGQPPWHHLLTPPLKSWIFWCCVDANHESLIPDSQFLIAGTMSKPLEGVHGTSQPTFNEIYKGNNGELCRLYLTRHV